jgi:hypothetical protein
MITSLNIEDQLLADAEAAAKAQGKSFRDYVQEALRISLATQRGGRPARFAQRSADLGVHIESPWSVLAEVENEEYIRVYTKK